MTQLIKNGDEAREALIRQGSCRCGGEESMRELIEEGVSACSLKWTGARAERVAATN